MAQLREVVKQLRADQETKLFESQKIIQAKIEIKEIYELMQNVTR